jgi:hypothetical protein
LIILIDIIICLIVLRFLLLMKEKKRKKKHLDRYLPEKVKTLQDNFSSKKSRKRNNVI